MKCEDYRNSLLSEPKYNSIEITEHLADCDSCRNYYIQIQDFEKKLQQTVDNVHIPEDFEFNFNFSKKRYFLTKENLFALAASLILVITLNLLLFDDNNSKFTTDVLYHVTSEPKATISKKIINPQIELAKFGVNLNIKKNWHTSYIEPCKVSDIESLHLVLRDKKQNKIVTMLLIPNKKFLDLNNKYVASSYQNGVLIAVIPTAHDNPQHILSNLNPSLELL
jgi:hypothetical protein